MITLSRRSLILDAVTLATLASRPALARTQAATVASRVAEGLFRTDPLPALSVAACRGNTLVFAEAFGEADLELAVAATTSHRFRMGSGAKPIRPRSRRSWPTPV